MSFHSMLLLRSLFLLSHKTKGNHVVPVSSGSGMVYISLATVHWKGALTQWLVHSKKRVASSRSETENFSLPIQQMDA